MAFVKTHCIRGHELSGGNVYLAPRSGIRNCRRCNIDRAKQYSIDNPEAARKNSNRASQRYHDKLFFGGNREKAIIRDGEKCVACGMSRVDHKEKYNIDITVDHIDGTGKNTPVNLRNNSMDNLQTLCFSCHGKKDVQRRANFRKREDSV